MSSIKNIDYNILFKFFDQKATLEEKALIKEWEQNPEHLAIIEDAYQIWTKQYESNMALDDGEAHFIFQKNTKKYTKHLFKKTLIYSLIISVLIIIASTVFFIQYYNHSSSDLYVIKTTNNSVGNTDILLSDSTHIILSRGGSLKIWEEKNNDNYRAIKLRGKAFFDVAKNKEKPFLIETGTDMVVKVVGTSFVLNTDSSAFDLGLMTGKVELVANDKLKQLDEKVVIIKPGQKVYYKEFSNHNMIEIDSFLNTNVAMNWITPKLNLKSLPLGNVLDNLSAWYKVDIKCDKLLREKYICTIQISDETLSQTLDILSIMLPLKITTYDGDKIRIQEK